MTDLFDKRTKKDRLLAFIQSRNWTKSSDVIRWGSANFYNRADRSARDLCSEGRIRRMQDDEKRRIFGPISEEVWVPIVALLYCRCGHSSHLHDGQGCMAKIPNGNNMDFCECKTFEVSR